MTCPLPKFLDPVTGDPVTWREGDTEPPILFTLGGGDLVANYTLTMHLRRPDGTILVLSVVDLGGSSGKFEFAADSLQAGDNQRAEIHRDDGVGSLFTWPAFLIDVDPRVGV